MTRHYLDTNLAVVLISEKMNFRDLSITVIVTALINILTSLKSPKLPQNILFHIYCFTQLHADYGRLYNISGLVSAEIIEIFYRRAKKDKQGSLIDKQDLPIYVYSHYTELDITTWCVRFIYLVQNVYYYHILIDTK